MPTTGRTLDDSGSPIEGTGFSYESDSVIAEYLEQRVGPLSSHPNRNAWAGVLPETDETQNVGFSIIKPGYEGPPPHYHTESTEVFEIVQGTFIFTLDGIEYRARAGDTITVEPEKVHTFECVGDELGLMKTTIQPPGKISEVIPSLMGFAHDHESDEDIWYIAAVFDELDGDTVFTTPPPQLTVPLAKALRPLADLQGYDITSDRYQTPEFWEAHVEQPAIDGVDRGEVF